MLLLVAACHGGDAGRPAASPTASLASSSPAASHSPGAASPAPGTYAPAPSRDLLDLARRFRGVSPDAARVGREGPFDYRVGDRESFFLVDLETPRVVTVQARVAIITEHAYFFVEEGIDYSPSKMERMGRDFETVVYPTVTKAFGKEWTPGVDGDPRITLLHARLRGAGGYFHQGDEYGAAAMPISNEREVVYLDAGALEWAGASYNALVAHELQHLIHFNTDPDEEAWVNEGLSQVASELVGSDSEWLESFLVRPDISLAEWPDTEDSAAHYAASELFFRYLLDRFGGRENARGLVSRAADGIAGVNDYLEAYGTTFQDVFADWAVANYLDADEGPFGYRDLDVRVKEKTTVRGMGQGEGEVNQFGADYLEIASPQGGVLVFDGAETVGTGVPPLDGAFWWSGRGDGIDARLTRELDLSSVTNATLRFSFWAQTENGWDYAYVAVSTDGGRTWKPMPGRHTTTYDPVRNAYGQGYTGDSGGWREEEMDLTPYVGGRVLLRFEYITDDATNLAGFAVDNVRVPELGLNDSGEDTSGWRSEGFRHGLGELPQSFIVQKIEGGQVSRIALDSHNRADVSVSSSVTIVVSAATEGTLEKALYRWELRPA